jgi:hypothetical protein
MMKVSLAGPFGTVTPSPVKSFPIVTFRLVKRESSKREGPKEGEKTKDQGLDPDPFSHGPIERPGKSGFSARS